MTSTMIQREAALLDLCDELRDQPWVALDTEFLRERTYYAQLCLIQLATPERIVCVDPLALPELDPLLAVLYGPTCKVLHSARQDLELFFDLRGAVPAPVFDTQIAAALLGYDEQIGYGPLVETLTGVKLAKGHTRTNWAARPLAAEQLEYAVDDVRYLRDVYLHLHEELGAADKLAWLDEECARLTDATLYSNAPEAIRARARQGHLLDTAAQTRLSALLMWRENTAREQNLPRNWVVHDNDLFTIARRCPRSLDDFTRLTFDKTPGVQRWAEEMLAVLAEAAAQAAGTVWPAPARLTREQTALYDEATRIIAVRAQARRVNPALVVTRRELERLIRGERDALVLRGWRAALVGDELRELLDKRA
jgi:ribonuclease D